MLPPLEVRAGASSSVAGQLSGAWRGAGCVGLKALGVSCCWSSISRVAKRVLMVKLCPFDDARVLPPDLWNSTDLFWHPKRRLQVAETPGGHADKGDIAACRRWMRRSCS